ncbi:MAG TPA: LPS assembly lipoprotein LptE [Gammaproteobacteria bacterium]|nr:LPS assembly lipoprotein LptE [Gammaproteobacteria bacterium]
MAGRAVAAARLARVLTAAALALAVAGCGYHLRGARKLPPSMQRLQLQVVEPYGPLAVNLRRALSDAGATLVGQSSGGRGKTAVLEILENRVRRRVVAVDSAGKAIEYELSLKVAFRVRANGRTLLSRQDLELTRDYPYNPSQALGNEAQQNTTLDAMRREMVDLIMLRLNAAAGGGPSGGSGGAAGGSK